MRRGDSSPRDGDIDPWAPDRVVFAPMDADALPDKPPPRPLAVAHTTAEGLLGGLSLPWLGVRWIWRHPATLPYVLGFAALGTVAWVLIVVLAGLSAAGLALVSTVASALSGGAFLCCAPTLGVALYYGAYAAFFLVLMPVSLLLGYLAEAVERLERPKHGLAEHPSDLNDAIKGSVLAALHWIPTFLTVSLVSLIVSFIPLVGWILALLILWMQASWDWAGTTALGVRLASYGDKLRFIRRNWPLLLGAGSVVWLFGAFTAGLGFVFIAPPTLVGLVALLIEREAAGEWVPEDGRRSAIALRGEAAEAG